MKRVIIFSLTLAAILGAGVAQATDRYVDNASSGCTSPDSTYDPATRACGSGSDTMYDTLGGCDDNSSSGDVCLVQPGTDYVENVASDGIPLDTGGVSWRPYGWPASTKVTILAPSVTTTSGDWSKTAGQTNVYEYDPGITPTMVIAFNNCPEITVTDPDNASSFTVEAGECIQFTRSITATVADVDVNEGSWYFSSPTLYIHTYDSGDPTASEYDIRMAIDKDSRFWINGDNITVEGFIIKHCGRAGTNSPFRVAGDSNTLRDVDLIDCAAQVNGNNNTVERFTSDLYMARGVLSGELEFHFNAGIRSFLVGNAARGNYFKDLTLTRGWNCAEFGTESYATRVTCWGFPNHAISADTQSNTIIDTLITYNTQDSLHISTATNITIQNSFLGENSVIQSASSGIKFRNNLFWINASGGLSLNIDDDPSKTGFDSDYNYFLVGTGDDSYKWGATGNQTFTEMQAIGQEANSIEEDVGAGPNYPTIPETLVVSSGTRFQLPSHADWNLNPVPDSSALLGAGEKGRDIGVVATRRAGRGFRSRSVVR